MSLFTAWANVEPRQSKCSRVVCTVAAHLPSGACVLLSTSVCSAQPYSPVRGYRLSKLPVSSEHTATKVGHSQALSSCPHWTQKTEALPCSPCPSCLLPVLPSSCPWFCSTLRLYRNLFISLLHIK